MVSCCNLEGSFQSASLRLPSPNFPQALCSARSLLFAWQSMYRKKANSQPDWLQSVFLREFQENWRIFASWIIAEPFTKLF
jgi:hypothetical protein